MVGVGGETNEPGILNANKNQNTAAAHRVNFLTLFSELDGFAEAAGLPVAALHGRVCVRTRQHNGRQKFTSARQRSPQTLRVKKKRWRWGGGCVWRRLRRAWSHACLTVCMVGFVCVCVGGKVLALALVLALLAVKANTHARNLQLLRLLLLLDS